MNSPLSAAIVSVLCLAGCSTPPAATERSRAASAARVDVAPTAAPSFRGSFTERAALTLLFEDVDGPSWDEGNKRLIFEKDNVQHYAAGVIQFPLQQQGMERLLLVFETNEADNECHACRGTIGAAIFSHDGETWRVTTAQRNVTSGPPYGASAEGAVSLLTVGPDRYALSISSSDMHFGVIQGGVSLFEVKPDFPDVFMLMLSGNNEGNCTEDSDVAPADADAAPLVAEEPCYDFSGDLAVVPGANAEYHDLAVAFRGTHVAEDDKKLVPFNETQRYVYRSGKYVPAASNHR
jgi:hypothetical protein